MNVRRGFGSLLLNVGCTILGGLPGIAMSSSAKGDMTVGVVVAVGAGAGLLTANLIDVAALAYDKAEPQSHASLPRLVPQVRFAPGVATVGLGGSF